MIVKDKNLSAVERICLALASKKLAQVVTLTVGNIRYNHSDDVWYSDRVTLLCHLGPRHNQNLCPLCWTFRRTDTEFWIKKPSLCGYEAKTVELWVSYFSTSSWVGCPECQVEDYQSLEM